MPDGMFEGFLPPAHQNSQEAELVSFRVPYPHWAHHNATHRKGSENRKEPSVHFSNPSQVLKSPSVSPGQQSEARTGLARVPHFSPHPL